MIRYTGYEYGDIKTVIAKHNKTTIFVNGNPRQHMAIFDTGLFQLNGLMYLLIKVYFSKLTIIYTLKGKSVALAVIKIPKS